jgi:hypothetical protein
MFYPHGPRQRARRGPDLLRYANRRRSRHISDLGDPMAEVRSASPQRSRDPTAGLPPLPPIEPLVVPPPAGTPDRDIERIIAGGIVIMTMVVLWVVWEVARLIA